MTWAQECEAKIRQQAADFQKRVYGESQSADELRVGMAAATPNAATATQPLPKGLDPTDKNADKIASDYGATILAKPASAWTQEERDFIRQSIGAFRGGK